MSSTRQLVTNTLSDDYSLRPPIHCWYRLFQFGKFSEWLKKPRFQAEFLDEFRIVPMTKPGAALGGQIHAALSKIGQTIGERDSMIAGIALLNNYILVTDNVGEMQRVAGLSVENWRSD
jgi:predicted nucleic acid-binding protein